jgi:hypothetical protein
MTKDVEALFRKINQSDLPYRVFDSGDGAPEADEIADENAPQEQRHREPSAHEATSAGRTASVVSINRSGAEPPPAEEPPLKTAGLFRRYAARGPDDGPQPVLLSEIFARMRVRL